MLYYAHLLASDIFNPHVIQVKTHVGYSIFVTIYSQLPICGKKNFKFEKDNNSQG